MNNLRVLINKIGENPTTAAIFTWVMFGLVYNYICNPDCGLTFQLAALHSVLPAVLMWFWVAIKQDAKKPVIYTAEEKFQVLQRIQQNKIVSNVGDAVKEF